MPGGVVMKRAMPEYFPTSGIKDDYNPAILLFGKRFFVDQTVLELMAEFLAVGFSEKWIGQGEGFMSPLPSLDELQKWAVNSSAELYYKPPVKLNLKLFAFLSCSRVDTRHDVHKEHYKYLVTRLKDHIKVSNGDATVAIEWIEELLRGFQGAGFNRTWCAQTFFPVSRSLLTRETIWNKSKEKKFNNWHESISNYEWSKHIFMARGGELLYLQLCNVFITKQEDIDKLAELMGFSKEETDLTLLHHSLQEGLYKLSGQFTSAFDQLVDFIELLDQETHVKTNRGNDRLGCAWCTRDSWRESYLFAVEINRLLSAVLDPVERLELFMTGCALQVLRSICAQSVRYAGAPNVAARDNAPGYAWLFSPPHSSSRQQRVASHGNLQVVLGVIQKALRFPDLQQKAGQCPDKSISTLYGEADKKYGHKLFLALAKKLGIVVPKTGSGARFIMTDSLLRYLVLVLLPPGKRCTYDEFLRRLYRHFGIAIEGDELADAINWSGLPASSNIKSVKESWLAEMLRAGGFLTELSDACSIVCNTFGE
jgi:hypothetical protein